MSGWQKTVEESGENNEEKTNGNQHISFDLDTPVGGIDRHCCQRSI